MKVHKCDGHGKVDSAFVKPMFRRVFLISYRIPSLEPGFVNTAGVNFRIAELIIMPPSLPRWLLSGSRTSYFLVA